MKWITKIPENYIVSKVKCSSRLFHSQQVVGIYPSVNFTAAEKSRNLRIVLKIFEAIISPVIMGILAGWGSWITSITSIIWWGVGVYGLFTNWEDFIIMIILRFLRIVE